MRVAALVLAAGRSTRMGGANKLLVPVEGRPMVARAVETLTAVPGVAPVLVVTGHRGGAVAAALEGLAVRRVHHPGHARGMGTSLAAGAAALAELDPPADAALVALGDMPGVRPGDVAALVASFRDDPGRGIRVPVHGGRRGHPVLFAARFFPEFRHLTGDAGARRVLDAHPDEVVEVPAEGAGVLLDVDTPAALEALRSGPPLPILRSPGGGGPPGETDP